jgi:methylenetetrahydrofolate dehydrogenase (NADP+) / methenyltetrahydrofolate cyclohydrolase
MTTVFDGYAFAQTKERALAERVKQLGETQRPHVAALLFTEDQGSVLYTRFKAEAAERVGIDYQVAIFSMRDSTESVLAKIRELNADPQVTGIIIQKPWRVTWLSVVGGEKTTQDFQRWWQTLTQAIAEAKDVDGLRPQTLAAIKDSTWKTKGYVLPATAKAVLSILVASQRFTVASQIVIIGKSDILGQPLFYELSNQGYAVEMIGSQELADKKTQGIGLTDKDIIISSTGRHHLITGDLVKEGVVVIDVGEPKPDVEFATVSPKASFITPVPGGVGPMTVVSLLENAIDLVERAVK